MKKMSIMLSMLLILSLLLSACGGAAASVPGSEPETQASAVNETPAAPAAEDGDTAALEPPAGAGEAADAPPAITDETLKILISVEPSNIMPEYSLLGDGQHVVPGLFDTLINFNSETKELEPNVATSWEWVDDTHLRLHLRDDVVAYDGTVLNANDVMYSIERGLDGYAAIFWKAIDINECSVEDDFTFVLGLNQIYPTIINQLAGHAMLTLLDESSVEANGGYEASIRNPKCTTGPYFFDEWKEGEYIRLVRNDNYWGELPYYKYVEYTFNSDNASRVMSLAANEVNIAVDLASVDLRALEAYENCSSAIVPASGVNVLYFNITNQYLSNPKVREAIRLTLDAQAINALGTGGTSAIADSPYDSASAVYSPPAQPIDRTVNIERAKELLKEAGYADGFTLNMFCQNFTQTLCEAIQADLLKIGIQVNLEVVETLTAMQRNDEGDFDISLAQTFTDDPVNVCNYIDDRMALNLRGGGIVGGMKESYDIIDRCRHSLDDGERMAAYAELQNFIRDNDLMIPFYEYSNIYGTNGSYDFMTNVIGVIKVQTVRPVG